METLIVIGLVLALAATVYLWIAVLPQKKAGAQKGKFARFLHSYFQFERLYIEDILKVLFTFLTCACVLVGFLLLFGRIDYWYYSRSTAGYGLLLMILGPVVSRIVYEFLMLTLLLVRNVMDINQKMPNGRRGHGCGHHHGEGCGCGHHREEGAAEQAEAPAAAAAPAQAPATEPEAPQAD